MIRRGLPPIPNKIVSHVRQDYTISISWAEGSKSSVQPSSNGSWFCPMMCLILTPSFFLGSTGQGVQQASTGCSQMNPEMPLLWQRLATSIREVMHVTGAWNQLTNLALSASYGNEPWKDKKMRNFRSWLIGVPRWRSTDPFRNWMRWIIVVEKTSTKRVPTVVALDGACYFAWGLPWFGGLSFVSRFWFEECQILHSKCSAQIMIPKTCNLHPTCTQPAPNLHPTCTQPAQLWLSETNCCCHLLPTSIELFPRGSQSSRSSSLCQGTPLLPSTATQCGPVKDHLSSVGFDPIFTDAQHGCTSEWTADSINAVPQHETCHGVGWRCKSRSLADQLVWKHGVILHRFATTSNQLIASCNGHFGWVCAC